MGLLQDLMGLRKGAQDFASRMRTVRARREELQREREDVLTAPANRADVKAIFSRWIGGAQDRYMRNLQQHMAVLIRKPKQFEQPESLDNYVAVCAIQQGMSPATTRSMDSALAALLGPMLQKNLFEMIDHMEWPGPEGLPLVARAERVEQIDREIEKLSAEEDELTRVANELRLIVD